MSQIVEQTIGLKEMQQIQAEMLQALHLFLGEHHIQYFMAYGTMLGAVRHKGFIPWDDDIDIAMLRKDFNQFLKVADQLPPPYKCRFIGFQDTHEKYPYAYAKIENMDYPMMEKDIKHLQIKTAIYIDVFVMDGVPDNQFLQKLHHKKILHLAKIRKLLLVDPDKDRGFVKNTILKLVNKRYSLPKIMKKYDKLIQKYSYTDTRKINEYSSVYEQVYENMEKKDFESVRLYDFEKYSFYGISNPHSYLTLTYGDYMQLPPENERQGHHHYEILAKE